jgi:hypothetical protein
MFEAHRERFPELASISREEAREWGKNIRMRHSPTGHLQTQLPSFGPIFDLLMMRSWTILAAPGASDFVCSDDPVVHLPAGTRPVDAPRGFGSEDAPVLMAVGRKHALLGTWPVEGDAPAWNSTDVDTKCVALMNWCVLFRARRFVASPSDDFVWRRGDGTIANRAALLELLVEAPRDPG